MTTITPCLWFDGNGLEAAEHYVSVIPDSRITDVSYYGPEQPGEQGAVMTVAFELAGRPFTALNGGPVYKFTEAVSLGLFVRTNTSNAVVIWVGLGGLAIGVIPLIIYWAIGSPYFKQRPTLGAVVPEDADA